MPVPRAEPTHRRPPGRRREELLRLLREADAPRSVADLAPLAGLHPNTVRAHLDVLVRTGHVARRTSSAGTPGRPRELYEATGPEPVERDYALLASVLATGLAALPDPAGSAVAAGRAWAEGATPGSEGGGLEHAVRMLRAGGFAPEVTEDGIRLHHCPFVELAVVQPDVVCAVHLGMIQGALEGSGVEATRIRPFVAPRLCIAELAHEEAG